MLINSYFVLLWLNMRVGNLKCTHTLARTHIHTHTHIYSICWSATWKHILWENVHFQRNPNGNKTFHLFISVVYSGLHTLYHIILTSLYSSICLLDSEAYVLYSLPQTKFLWKWHSWTRIPVLQLKQSKWFKEKLKVQHEYINICT